MDEKKTEVSIKVSAPYDADSCEGVLAICSWIKEAVCKCGIEIKSEEYSFRCSFKAGDISYDCYSVDEFKKHAFGQMVNRKSMRSARKPRKKRRLKPENRQSAPRILPEGYLSR